MTTVSSLAGASGAPWPEDAIEIGRVLDAWGIKGWIKIQTHGDDPQALLSAQRWHVKPPEDKWLDKGTLALNAKNSPVSAADSRYPSQLVVAQAREHGGLVVAQVQGVTDRTGAEALRGVRLFLARAAFPKPRANEYYWIDLIGLAVVNRQGEALGTVLGLIDTGPHSVLRLQRPAGEVVAGVAPAEDDERLIPFVAAYIDDVSLPERRITADWGLDY